MIKVMRAPWGASRRVRVGLQVLMAPPGGPSERQVHWYKGRWWQRDAEAMCRYEEHDRSTVTTLKFSNGELTLLRQGGIACRQVFRAGETGRAFYRTPHGAWPIAWQCHALEMERRENAVHLAQLRFSYDLELGGQHLGKYEVLVDVHDDQCDGASDDMFVCGVRD